MALVSDPPEALVLELGELDAVGGVANVEVEHGPYERQAAALAGEPCMACSLELSAQADRPGATALGRGTSADRGCC